MCVCTRAYARMHVANARAHTLKRACEQVRLITQELGGHIAELLQWNRPGVVRSMADMIARTRETQADMIKGVAKALRLAAPHEHPRLVPAVLLLEHVAEDYASVPGAVSSLLGSLLLQTLVTYEEEHLTPLLKSFAGMSTDYLARIACDNAGSRALEAFYASGTVPLKAKAKLTEKLAEDVVRVASDRCGSHVIEQAYRAATVERKRVLVEALAREFKTIAKSHFGALVCKRCRVEQFVSGAAEWEESLERAVKKRDLFADIIGEDEGTGGRHKPGGDRPKKTKGQVDGAERGTSDKAAKRRKVT